MAVNAGIRIEGMGAFRRDLKKIDENLTKELRSDLLLIGQAIATEAAAQVPRRSGKAAGSIRAGVSGNNAYVAGGKKTVPYYGWLDFGSRTPRLTASRSYVSKRTKTSGGRIGPWTGSGRGPKGGRFLYPTIAKNKPMITRLAKHAFDKATDAALKKSY